MLHNYLCGLSVMGSGVSLHGETRHCVCYFYCMTLLEAYRGQLRTCLAKGLKYDDGHYETTVDFGGKDFYVSPDGEDVVRYKFNVTGCMKTRVIKTEKKTKVLHFHKDRLPVYGTITRHKALKGFLYKYLLFLRCDGIEDVDLIKLYLLHCLTHRLEFWRKTPVTTNGLSGQVVVEYKDWELYEPNYEDIKKMVDGLIGSALKAFIDDKTREQFIVRTRCVVNPTVNTEFGGIRDKVKSEKRRDAKKGCRAATDNRILANYDPELTEEQLAQKVGVSVGRIREWKADNRERLETLKDRINRMYDESISPRKNAEKIGCSVNSVRKYADKLKAVPAEEETDDAWFDKALEEMSAFWDDVPSVGHKDNDEMDDLMELLEDLD